MGSAADVGDEVDSVEDHLLEARRHGHVQGEAPLTGDGDAEQEQIDPSPRDRLMGEVQEEAPLTQEGDAEQEQSVPSSGYPSTSDADEEAPSTSDADKEALLPHLQLHLQATPHHLNGILRHYLNMTIWFPIHNRTIRRRP